VSGGAPGIRVVATLGDPRGIGPEVIVKAARALRRERPEAEIFLLGDAGSLDALGNEFDGQAVGDFDGSLDSAGTISLEAIREGVERIRRRQGTVLVTGPVHKPALRAAGSHFPGQTELLQELAGASRVGMLMHADTSRAGAPLRILLATTHLPLRDVPERLTPTLLEVQILLFHESLRDRWRIPAPRLVLCALNPHASDGGLFGDEEARILTPAVEAARARGVEVTGPLPADTAFLTLLDRTADGVVVPYHDVGMAVFKTLAFGHGVNVTLGLPFVRTSPDHGTAFDLVGTGRADPSSALEAFRLAARLASAFTGDAPEPLF
jgi:4-hydroxythreonine-4-phosphate dehydrogenase